MTTLTEAQRAQRNLSPHAEALLASILWRQDFKAHGNPMDFWDALDGTRKRFCTEQVELIQTTKSVVPA